MFSPFFFFVILFPSLIGITGIALGAGDSLMINNASELIAFSNSVNNGTNYKDTNVLLNSDIDFTGLSQQFEPIGKNSTVSFQGTFDGQGHIISNFNPSFSSSYANVGLFGSVSDGSIYNVVMDSSCSISSTFYYGYPAIGGIVGDLNCDSCYVSNSVNMASLTLSGNVKTAYIGGVVGYFSSYDFGSSIYNCVNYGTISVYGDSEYSYIGGIVGYSTGGDSGRTISIDNCLNYGTISHNRTASKYIGVGGIVGWAFRTYLENCVSAGKIETKNNTYVASMIGLASSYVEITNSFWTSDVGTSNSYASDIYTMSPDASLVDLTTDTLGKLNTYSAEHSLNSWFTVYTNGGKINDINQEVLFTNNKYFPDPSKKGHTFVGWYKDSAFTEEYDPQTTTRAMDVYAKFTYSNYTITFNVNGGNELAEDKKTVTFNSSYGELPRPTRTGHTFAGWTNDKNESITSETIVSALNDHTLHAQWAINEYAITFEFNNGTEPEVRIFVFGTPIDYPEKPMKTGYTSSWDKALETMPAENLTITTQWSPNKYTITFDVNGGNELAEDKMTVTFDSSYGVLPTPNKTGHTFAGWTNDKNESVTSETIVSALNDHTLFAQWEEIVTTQVEIVFDAKDMSTEEIEKIVRVHTKAEFTITRVEDDATGETKVIIEFTDTTKAEEFVRSVRTLGERSDNKIKKVDYTRREVNQDLSPSLHFLTAILLTAIFTI